MEQQIIKAVFKGQDGSLGYKKDQQYTLILKGMSIERVNGLGKCEYSTIQTFMENWDVIQQAKY